MISLLSLLSRSLAHRGRSRECAPIGGLIIGGDYQGLGIARSLGRKGIPVCILDDEHSIARASRYARHHVRVPDLRDPKATLQALTATRDRLRLEGWVLYPTRDETVASLAMNRRALAEDFRVPTPTWETVRCVWDKRETYRLAEELSIPMPRTWVPRHEADLAGIDAGAPLVIKPAIKERFFYATGVKAWRADSHAEVVERYRRAAAIAGDGEIVVQEMVPGDGRAQYSFCAFFKGGRAVATMTTCRRRQHPSEFGRASTFVETVDLPELEPPSVRFLQAIGYYGLVELEYKRDVRDGQYKLLDVNARTWGYHSLGVAAGVDFPYLLYCDQVGTAVQHTTARPGVRWVRLSTDFPNALRDIYHRSVSAGDYIRSLKGIDTEAVFSLRDPLPGLYELALLPYLTVKRGL